MKDRLKDLRRELGYTQQEFAEKIGIKRNTFAQYENGRNEPIDAVIKLICDTFHVSEKWLRTGEGEMFIHVSRDDELLNLIEKSMTEESGEIKRRFATAIMKLNSEQIQACTDWIKNTFDLVEREKTTYSVSFDPEQIIKEKVASYEAELRAELFSKASQGASQTGSTDTGSHKAI